MRGLTLIEVMVTLVIGLILTLGITGIMATNRQNLRITEGLSESQENARMAFELIARDVRQARDTGCGPVPDVSDHPSGGWMGEWWPIRGFAGDASSSAVVFGSGTGERVNGTEAVQLQSTGETLLINNIPSTDKITLTSSPATLAAGPVIICTLDRASLHTATGATGMDLEIDPVIPFVDPDNPPFLVGRYQAVTWYIGNNGRADEGGRSLYRVRLQPDGNPVTEEILPGIVDMSLLYHQNLTDDFTQASDISTKNNWNAVNAIELTLITETTQADIATDAATGSELVGSSGRLRRSLTHIIALRNMD